VKVLADAPGTGKTTRLIAWLLDAERASGYPGWTRVIIVHNYERYAQIRSNFGPDIPDFAHRVFTWPDWSRAQAIRADTEVAVDDMLELLPYIPGQLVGFTLRGEVWTDD
jgi:hypothetical protein